MVTIVWLDRSRVDLQAQPSQHQPHHSQVTEPSSLNNIRPAENFKSTLYNVFESISRLSVQQQYLNESIAKSDRHLAELLSCVSSIRETADGLTKKLNDRKTGEEQ